MSWDVDFEGEGGHLVLTCKSGYVDIAIMREPVTDDNPIVRVLINDPDQLVQLRDAINDMATAALRWHATRYLA